MSVKNSRSMKMLASGLKRGNSQENLGNPGPGDVHFFVGIMEPGGLFTDFSDVGFNLS